MRISIITVVSMIFSVIVPAYAQQDRTIRSEMKVIHEMLGINFVYDSSMELDVPYSGESMKDVAGSSKSSLLDECLKTLFVGTGIEYDVMKKYVVLTKADAGRKPRNYTVFVEEQQDTLDESRITAFIDRRHVTTQTGMTPIDGSRFRKGYAVLGSPDLIKELQILPGVSGGTELLSGMYVHGGDGTDNLFLVDGVPLYQVSHLVGLISSFNTEVVDNIDFYTSGFPSRFGGKLSSVVDITTKSGDFENFRGSFNIGLLNGGIRFGGPIIPGRTSFNVAVRRSWFDAVTVPLNFISNLRRPYGDSGKIGYSMTDLNASVTHLFDKDSRLRLNVYAGSDKVTYRWEDLMVKYWEGTRYTGTSGYDLDVRWGNVLTSLDWRKKFSDDLHFNAVLYYVRSNSGIGMTLDDWKMDVYSPAVTVQKRTDRNYSKMHDVGVKAELDWIPSGFHHVNAGVSYAGHLYRPVREYAVDKVVDEEPAYSERDSYSAAYNASEASVFVSDEISPVRWFKINIGLRYSHFGQDGFGHHSVEPRAAMRFQLGRMAAMKVSYAEMSQSVHLVRANYLDIPMATWLPSTGRVAPMRSRQVAGGFSLALPHGISLDVGGYWKSMGNLYEYCGTDEIFPDISDWENQLISGEGRSYGAEVEARWRTPKMDIAAYYTLSWTERFFEGIWHDWYPARNDNRHKLTLTATRKFGDRFEMYAGWHYHTGDRSTVATQVIGSDLYFTGPYNYKLSDYHRLDLGFDFHKTTKRGNESIWNLTLYNAYCRMNPMFTILEHFKPTDGEEYSTKFVEASVIPIIPSFNYTLRF